MILNKAPCLEDPTFIRTLLCTTKREGEEGDHMWFDAYDDAFNELQGPIAKPHFQGSLVSGFCWIKKEQSKPNKEGNKWLKMRCPHFNSSVSCPAELHIVYSTKAGKCYIAFACFWEGSQ
jgi:hypothetical protein